MGYSGEAAFHVMAESMSLRTVGRRFSAVLGSSLALVTVLACSGLGRSVDGGRVDDTAEDTASNAADSRAERSQPERVVQRMEPARASLPGTSAPASDGTRAGVAAQPSPNGSSSGTPAGSSALTAANTPRQVETISPKHLEAELNRLEAEIGN